MIKFLNRLLIHFNYKIIRVIPRPNKYKFKKNLTKAEVSRRFKINYNKVGWVHVYFAEKYPEITHDELLRLVKEEHEKNLAEHRALRAEIKKERLSLFIANKEKSLQPTKQFIPTNNKEVAQ